MGCAEIRDQMSQYLDEEMGLEDRWRMDRHVAGCADCAGELERLRGLRALVRAADPVREGVATGGGGEAFRVATLAKARLLLDRRRNAGAPRRLRIWLPPAAAAAALVAAAVWLALPGRPAGTGPVDPSPVGRAPVAGSTPRLPTPEDDYRDRRAALAAGEVVGRFKLGLWCEEQGLVDEAKATFREVVALDPDHAPARERLGQVPVNETWMARRDAEARGFRCVRGEWVSGEDAERMARGLRRYRGEWLTAEQILLAKGFVPLDGLWMTPEERDGRLRGERTPRPEDEVTVRGIAAGLAPESLHLLEGIVVGEPRVHAHLAVYPLLAAAPVRSGIRTMDEAARRGQLEVLDHAEVTLRNRGPEPVFLPSGQILVGGHQDRVNLRSLVIAPGEVRALEVRCCEQNRSKGPSREFNEFAFLAPPSIRLLGLAGNQEAIWNRISGLLIGSAAQNQTRTLRAAFDEDGFAVRQRGYAEALGDPAPGHADRCIGMVTVIGDRVVSLDLFGGSDLFAREYPKLLTSAVAEVAAGTVPPAGTPTRRFVRSFVERLAFAH